MNLPRWLTAIENSFGRFNNIKDLQKSTEKLKPILARPINHVRFKKKLPLFWNVGQVQEQAVAGVVKLSSLVENEQILDLVRVCLRTNAMFRIGIGELDEIVGKFLTLNQL